MWQILGSTQNYIPKIKMSDAFCGLQCTVFSALGPHSATVREEGLVLANVHLEKEIAAAVDAQFPKHVHSQYGRLKVYSSWLSCYE